MNDWLRTLTGWELSGVGADLLLPVGLALAACLVLLYAIRVRRRRVAVPWVHLWKQAMAPRRAARLWDRLKRWVSLLLALLLLALLLLALADPRPPGETSERVAVVVLLDTSASMNATDEEGGAARIERARELALQALRSLAPNDQAMLVTFDDRVVPRTPLTDDLETVRTRLAEVRALATPTDLAGALTFATHALQGQPRGRIVVISDGAGAPEDVDALASLPIGPQIEVQWQPVGTAQAQNLAITALSVRRYPANRTNYEVFVQAHSYAAVPVQARLSLWSGDALLQTQVIELASHEAFSRIYTELPAAGRILRATLTIEPPTEATDDGRPTVVDALPTDNEAWALLPDAPPPTVLVVTAGNLYLEAPLLLNESVRTDLLPPDSWHADVRTPTGAPYDIVIFDGIAPAAPPTGNYLYLAPQGPDAPWAVNGEVSAPIVHTSQRGHALLRWVTALRDVNILRAPRLVATTQDEVIASAIGGAPMLLARTEPTRRLVALAIPLTESDLALRVAWPVFLLNVIDWFMGDDARALEGLRTGTTWEVPLPDRTLTRVMAQPPQGAPFAVPARDGRAVLRGDQTGIWTFTVPDAPAGATSDVLTRAAGNLADAGESSIAARPDLVLPGRAAPPADNADTALESARWILPRDAWWLLVLAALGLLLLEWVTWQRRWTV